MRQILKNNQGKYFTRQNGNQRATHNLDLAERFTPEKALLRAQAFNRDFDDTMHPVDYDTEVLAYYPVCAYHASDELDARMYADKIKAGEANGQFSKAVAVRIQGLWFVYARKEGVTA